MTQEFLQAATTGGLVVSRSSKRSFAARLLCATVAGCAFLGGCASDRQALRSYNRCDYLPKEEHSGFFAKNSWIVTPVPSEPLSESYDSDDLRGLRPSWKGRDWEIQAVYPSAEITRYVDKNSVCEFEEDGVVRQYYNGDWLGFDGLHLLLWREAAPERRVLVSLKINPPEGLFPENLRRYLDSTSVDWEQID